MHESLTGTWFQAGAAANDDYLDGCYSIEALGKTSNMSGKLNVPDMSDDSPWVCSRPAAEPLKAALQELVTDS